MKSTGNHSVRVEGAVQSGQGGYGQGYSGNATVKEAAETLQLEHNSLRIQLHLKHSQLPSYAFLDSMIAFNALYRPYLPLSRLITPRFRYFDFDLKFSFLPFAQLSTPHFFPPLASSASSSICIPPFKSTAASRLHPEPYNLEEKVGK